MKSFLIKTEQISFRVTEEHFTKIQELANKSKKSISSFVRDVVLASVYYTDEK